MYCKKCGGYSGKYPLCNKCYYEENEDFDEEYEDEDFDEEDTCEICGEYSNGYPLCKTCYYKVKEYAEEHFDEFYTVTSKTIIEHDNLQDISEETADYRKKYPAEKRCHDGHYVRSGNEALIDNKLYEQRIFHEYEKRYKAKDGKTYYPDFYLPDANLYIEYFGVNENESKNEKKKKVFLQDKTCNFEFITSNQHGILEEVIEDILEKYNLKNK